MTLKEYIKQLEDYVKMYPDYLDKEVFYSVDDEGNEFKPVRFKPSVIEVPQGKKTCIN